MCSNTKALEISTWVCKATQQLKLTRV